MAVNSAAVLHAHDNRTASHLPCSFYYVKSYTEGTGIVRLPAGIV